MNCDKFCSLLPTPYSLFPIPRSAVPFGITINMPAIFRKCYLELSLSPAGE
ncbi:hypothetical protein [Moorena producens]|uniref:hypothetical protein n=1 Tax=Moorena producens TaxID=1155739 RepID=UPI003C796635